MMGGVERGFMKQKQPIPQAFCGKSLDLLDGKGLRIFGRDKQFARVSE
jgi:hypothetical protein